MIEEFVFFSLALFNSTWLEKTEYLLSNIINYRLVIYCSAVLFVHKNNNSLYLKKTVKKLVTRSK